MYHLVDIFGSNFYAQVMSGKQCKFEILNQVSIKTWLSLCGLRNIERKSMKCFLHIPPIITGMSELLIAYYVKRKINTSFG